MNLIEPRKRQIQKRLLESGVGQSHILGAASELQLPLDEMELIGQLYDPWIPWNSLGILAIEATKSKVRAKWDSVATFDFSLQTKERHKQDDCHWLSFCYSISWIDFHIISMWSHALIWSPGVV